MVEYNAQGLHSFFTLIKNLSVSLSKFGKEWLVYLFHSMVKNSKAFKDFMKKKLHEYFVKEDLDKETL